MALDGHAYRAFDLDVFRLELLDTVGTLTVQNYSYPPHAMLIAAPFALLPYEWSFVLWSLLSLAFFYWAAKPDVEFAPILAVLTPAAALSIWNGHYGLVLGALWLLYFRFLKERPVLAGLVASTMTFKPHMGLFVGLTALMNWRTFLAAIAGTGALILVSGWLFDWASWYGFIGQTIGTQTEILTRRADEFYFRLMPSAYTAYGRGTLAAIAQVAFAVAALVLVIKARRMDPFALATATFLIVPYVFVYDMTVVCLGFANILWRDWSHLGRWERIVLTLGFLSPAITMLIGQYTPLLAPPILLAALYVQLRRPPFD